MSFERAEQPKPSDTTATAHPFEQPMAHELRQISAFANNAAKNDSQQMVKTGVLPDVQIGKSDQSPEDWTPSPLEQGAKNLADSILGFDDWVQKQGTILKEQGKQVMNVLHDGFFGHSYGSEKHN